MKVILLSGGSGKRLWPLSNNSRSKQFLRLLAAPDGSKESMIQRVVRQLEAAGVAADGIVVATGAGQHDAVSNQLGPDVNIVTEPTRRRTFPAIALACASLAAEGTPLSEPVIVMPCDTYASDAYFAAIGSMHRAVEEGVADIVLMGVRPTFPTTKYGYIVPRTMPWRNNAAAVERFIEKPDVDQARELLYEGALWNGGVFAFRLGYMMDLLARYIPDTSFANVRARYSELPEISFDYEVVERCSSLAVVPYYGEWRDLGTWNTLTDELTEPAAGNVILDSCTDTCVINELEIPMVCIGAKDMVIAASPDGIIVSERKQSEKIKHLVKELNKRPMYEERRWGIYKVIESVEFPDGFCALTKQLTLNPGCALSYQRHSSRDEVWTFINGEGEIVLDGERKPVKRGDVITIPKGCLHTLRANTSLTFIEVQQGTNLIEEDIERFDYEW
ncbi:MAG: cupin domain-containing protein [Bacteroides sp.]|nr:cupin domain-containing protein [Bacteroidales bacterium]MBD5317395.1 cupin domain-containing protein [Bacteroides sp.]